MSTDITEEGTGGGGRKGRGADWEYGSLGHFLPDIPPILDLKQRQRIIHCLLDVGQFFFYIYCFS